MRKKTEAQNKKDKRMLHILLSVFVVVVGSIAGGLLSIFMYDYLYKIGKVNIYTMMGVLVLAMGVMLPELMIKLSKS